MKNILSSILIACFMMACNQQGSKQNTTTVTKQDSVQQKGLSTATACLLSEIVYCKDPQTQMDQYMPGWKIVWDPREVRGNYAFIASDGNSFALVMRGSLIEFSWSAFDNWIYNDLNVADQDNWPYTNNINGAKVSQGSYIGWQNLNKLVDKKTGQALWTFLQKNVSDKNSLTITGHSLGGNLACIYGSYLWKKYKDSGHPKNNLNVITFAAPATGNKEFADDFNSKFPNSLRVENINDLIPKFPVSDKISELGSFYSPAPDAGQITVGYKGVSTKLNNVFITLGAAVELLRITNGISPYVQTNGLGDLITVKISGKNIQNEVTDWFNEVHFQHDIEQYAAAIGCPVIKCDQH